VNAWMANELDKSYRDEFHRSDFSMAFEEVNSMIRRCGRDVPPERLYDDNGVIDLDSA